ncbi:hypothetical protein Y919_07250 [Caloranaerobacter azorensis H53214]|uniref:Radical SAM core domain-containing protein n=1 Tax=Caloranaerobacter azorensis H53214 TaxID=1156417 RepID=A0A096BH79_9FIRM|nr:radical SAM protein [Caloranaerobacter azorensis]KGG80237.1 hypothetical protein Y919_07250 [Caloranaerobacter azorensis H53214]
MKQWIECLLESYKRFPDISAYICEQMDENNLIISPLTATFAIEESCNLKCKHCWGTGVNKNVYNPSTELLMLAINKLSKVNILKITITGGEVFLREDIWEIIKQIKKCKMMLTILTNGTLLDESNIEKLAANLNLKTDIVQVSLDGTERIHNIQRNTDIYIKVIKAIRRLRSYDVKIRVHFVATPINVSSMEDTYKVVNDLGVDIFSVVPVYGQGKGLKMSCELDYYKYLEKIYKVKLLSQKGRTLFQYVIPIQIFYYLRDVDLTNRFIKSNFRVSLLKCLSNIAINVNGDFYPYNLIHKDFLLGNIYQQDIPNFNENEVYSKILAGRDLNNTKCMACKFFNYCQGGDLLRTYRKYRTFDMPDPDCLL